MSMVSRKQEGEKDIKCNTNAIKTKQNNFIIQKNLQMQLCSLASISMWASKLTLFPDRARSRGERASPETASSFFPSVEKPGALPEEHRHPPLLQFHLQHFLIRFWSLVSLHRWPSSRRHSDTHWRMNNSRTSGITHGSHGCGTLRQRVNLASRKWDVYQLLWNCKCRFLISADNVYSNYCDILLGSLVHYLDISGQQTFWIMTSHSIANGIKWQCVSFNNILIRVGKISLRQEKNTVPIIMWSSRSSPLTFLFLVRQAT